jgi:hypothetical protein
VHKVHFKRINDSQFVKEYLSLGVIYLCLDCQLAVSSWFITEQTAWYKKTRASVQLAEGWVFMLTIIFSIPLPMRAVLVSYQLKRASGRAIKAIMRRNLRPWSKKCGSAAAAEIVGQQQPSNQRQLEKDRIAIKSLSAQLLQWVGAATNSCRDTFYKPEQKKLTQSSVCVQVSFFEY